MCNCINLKQMFGDKYRVGRDPAFFAEYGAGARTPDPWYWRILCRHGHIYPHGDEMLGASTDRRGAIANRLRRVTGVEVVQDGSDGVNVVFPVRCFPEVAKILKARKRRRLDSAHREALVAAGTAALDRYRKSGVDSRTGERNPTPSTDFQLAC